MCPGPLSDSSQRHWGVPRKNFGWAKYAARVFYRVKCKAHDYVIFDGPKSKPLPNNVKLNYTTAGR